MKFSARASDGAFGRFFDGPPPGGDVTAWQSNGGIAIEIAAAALAPNAPAVPPTGWGQARYVVKAITTSGYVIWLTRQGDNGFRSISERCLADVFETQNDARRAIDNMPSVFASTGIRFRIEPTDADS